MDAKCPDHNGTAPGSEQTYIQAMASFEGDGGCIAEARRVATAFLGEARLGHGVPVSVRAVDVTQLVVSELVTNARKYAPGPVLMDLRIVGEILEIAIWDSGPHLPVVHSADPERLGRHGLEIVTALVESYRVSMEPVGKCVTVRIPLREAR
ncbi:MULTISPECIES: ATP-binding protein [Streptomyces]|uniref:ATP-binding protein n=1 Tax=Streptomyces doudnae TaxID=3075536 RepID=A0ABD5EWV6_9ACTN|nr:MULTISPECIES: ATP-binding protein [unclassified Streptomyces]MDT0439193.1 ATP-binding protein [Streptomyces sp. DSM 41981]MYQ65785.1 ATP-binding protein [Streptomyces sp. SID4950]SCE07682.1 Anti-sigma regulatory factor (Ser/Thr protein kinase) [Streptomyces sp. SolWspMP-5a-2]